MLKIYGSMLCPDCVKCKEELDRAGVEYRYFDFAEDLASLKIFLSLRDGSSLFDEVRSRGGVGIPCIVKEDGSLTLTWEEFLK